MSQKTYDLLNAAAHGRIGVDRRLFREITTEGESAVPDILRFFTDDRSEDPIGIEMDAVNILRIINSPQALPLYIHLVRQQPHEVEDELMEAFMAQGQNAVEPLLDLYEELGEEEGGEVAFLLASLQVHDDRIRKILLDRLEYDAWDASITLGLYADAATAPQIEAVLATIPDDEENRSLRVDLARAIEDVKTPRQKDAFRSAEEILEAYQEEAPPEFHVLSAGERLQLLAHATAAYRAGAAESFFGSELGEAERQKLFDIAQSDADEKVRAAAWRTLSAETQEHPEIALAMRQRIADESVSDAERGGLIVGLALEMADPEVRGYAEQMYQNERTREAALEAMRRSLDRDFALYFPKHLSDADPEIRRQAIWGVGYLNITSEADKLTKLMDEEEFRADALFAYALSMRGETTRGLVKGMLRKIEEEAGGLSEPEEELVMAALDERLALHGLEPVFAGEGEDEEAAAPATTPAKAGRNDPCPCGSGKKFKKCCGA